MSGHDRAGSQTPAGTPHAGDLLAETYRLGRSLGAGASGIVFHAVDEQLDREVAIKFLDVQAAEQDVTAMLRDEARAMARVQHPNVVHIHHFGVHAGRPYFVMEYVPGPALRAEDPGWRSVDATVAVLEQVCRGVSAIHAAGAVHNDLKPGNILLGPGWRVVVSDFGLASRVDRAVPRQLAGSPAYIAPEVAREEAVDPSLLSRRDIYALGVIAFEMLAGRRPFTAKALAGLLHQHAYEPPPRFSTLRGDLPPAFDDFFARVLAKDPAERIASAEHVRHELLKLHRLAAANRRPLRIIVAEDDPAARYAVVEALGDEFAGAEIRSFSDGEAACAAACEAPPDVVLTDLHMPGAGGLGLTAALRADARTRAVPIIVVTGQGGARDWEELRKLGADRFLVKPLALDGLVAAIRAVTQ